MKEIKMSIFEKLFLVLFIMVTIAPMTWFMMGEKYCYIGVIISSIAGAAFIFVPNNYDE